MEPLTERQADEEAEAAKRALEAIGLDPDGPLCPYCGSDWHVKPDCPTAALQAEERRRLRERQEREMREYGKGKVMTWGRR